MQTQLGSHAAIWVLNTIVNRELKGCQKKNKRCKTLGKIREANSRSPFVRRKHGGAFDRSQLSGKGVEYSLTVIKTKFSPGLLYTG